MSIQNLIDTYMGNPAPLARKVQQDSQGQPSGGIPPDLEQALALQKIQEMHQAAQTQQAMQAGGPQPTVVQKLQQMLAQAQHQAQPQGMMPPGQGQPQGAPQGAPQMPQMPPQGGIDQLPTNVGQHMAGGGIVAFSGEDERVGSKVPKPDAEDTSSQFVRDISKLPQAFNELKQRAREEDAIKAAQDKRMEQYQQDKLAAQQKTSFFNYLFGTPSREQEGLAKLTELSNAPLSNAMSAVERNRPTMINDPRLDQNYNTTPTGPGAPAPTAIAPPAAPRPPAAQTPRPSMAAGASSAKPDGLDAALEKQIMGDLALNRESERDKGADYFKKTVGLDTLLQEMEARNQAREARIAENKAERTPEWIKGLQALGGAPIHGGIGMVLGKLGQGATAAREAYGAEDMKYADEMDKLRDIITKAKIEGNTAVANAGMAALKETDAARRAAMTSGTSLQSNRNTVAQRMESARQHNETMAFNRANQNEQRNMVNAVNAVKNDEVINRLQKRAETLDKSMIPADKAEASRIGQQIADRQRAIYKMFQVPMGNDIIPAAPGASSLGGIRPPLSAFQKG